MHDKYIAAYTEVDKENRDNLALSLKKSMKSELFNASGETQYPIHGDGYTGGVAVVKITSMDTPDDMQEFKDSIGADYVAIASNSRTAESKVKDKRADR